MRAVLSTRLVFLLTLSLSACGAQQPFVGTKALPPHQPAGGGRFLHQEGRALVGPDGQRRVIRAVNLGGWLHWEHWIFGAKINFFDLESGGQSQLLRRFEEMYGAEAARRFEDAISDRFMTQEDFRAIAAYGFDAVRLPVNHRLLESEGGRARLKRAVAGLGEAGLGVILDLHSAPGGQSKLFTADPDKTLLWDDPANEDRLVRMWSELAAEYKDDPRIWGYDLLNEPDAPEPKRLLALYERLIAAVREHDKEHLVIIEGDALSRDFNLFERRLDANMAYSPHVYLWVGNPDETWLERLAKLEELHDVPVWIGEFGEDRLPDIERLRKGFEKFSGWAVWTWKKVELGGTPAVTSFEAPEAWLKLLESLEEAPGTAAVMSEDEAFAALEAFLEAAKTASVNPEMAKALGLG